MRKGRGFQLKGFSTGNGKTHKANKTGRQFGTKILPGLSPLSYSPDGVKPNSPKGNYVDEEAQDRADDIAHGDGISTPRPEETEPPVDSGMPAVDPYSGDMTLSSMYGDQTWDGLTADTRKALEERRSKEGYNSKADSSHPDSFYNAHASYLTEAEKIAGGNYRKYNPNSEFAQNLKSRADREGYNTDAMSHATKSDAWKTTGTASFTTFHPETGERLTRNIRNPKFKPNNEQKVSLDTKQVQSVEGPKTTTGKPIRGTQTKPTSTKTKPTGTKPTGTKPTGGNKAKHKNYTERTGKQTKRGTGKTYEDVWATSSDEYKAKYGGDKKKAIQEMKDWNDKQDAKKNKNKKK